MHAEPPKYLIEHCDRLLALAERMSGLDEDLGALRGRLERADLSALRIGMRRIAEGVLRHLARTHGVFDDDKRARVQFEELRTEVTRVIGGQVTADFRIQLENLQQLGNVSAHFRFDDVYKSPDLRPANPWAAIQTCFSALEHVLHEFVHLCPPPTPPVNPPEELGAVKEGGTSPTPPVDRTERPSVPLAISDAQLAELTVSRVEGDPAVRDRLAELTGWSRTKITRRLRAAHGNTRVRRVFPSAFEDAVGTLADEAESFGTQAVELTYEVLGECTLKQVRDLELEDELAKLSGLSAQTIRRRLSDNRGNSLVRRVFPEWYDAGVIVQLTVRTALDYGMETVLARHLGVSAVRVHAQLRAAPGQTKLGTVVKLY